MLKYLCLFLLFILASCNGRDRSNRGNQDSIKNAGVIIAEMYLENNDPNTHFDDLQNNGTEVNHGTMTHFVTVNLRLRDRADLNSAVITTLQQNTAIKITEIGIAETIDGITAPWIRVISENGYSGWCFSGYVSLLGTNQQMQFNFPLSIENNVRGLFLPHQNNSDMRAKIEIIYWPESCSIKNIAEIQNERINLIFDRPILNKDIYFASDNCPNAYFDNIVDLLFLFGIGLSSENMEAINNPTSFGGYNITRIAMENLNLYTLGFGGKSAKVFVIEYENNCTFYDFNLRIGTNREDIIEKIGNPHFTSEERGIDIYSCFITLRQINLFYKNDEVVKVQLISWAGR